MRDSGTLFAILHNLKSQKRAKWNRNVERSETTPLGSVSYTHDSIGRRTSMTVAGQPTVNYSYDSDNRLVSVGATLSGRPVSFDFAYDTLGRRTSTTYPNGVTSSFAYDDASRLTDLQHVNPLNSVLESLGYTYDANGNRISMDRQNVTLPRPASASNIAFNAANQMVTFNVNPITYDDNGNMTSMTNSCGTTNYTWDARNRLIGIQGFDALCAMLSASFQYDALGRRIEKTINARTIQYLYDGQDIVQEIENGLVSVNYIRTLNIDEPLARIESAPAVVRYYQRDALGSVIGLTDESGQMVTTYAYDAFGKVSISGEISDNPFQYTGRENDNTGLYYYRARYYSPELQRFISEDPILKPGNPKVPFMVPYRLTNPGMLNAYLYVANAPVNLIDPLGLESCTPCHTPPPPPPKSKDRWSSMKEWEWIACKLLYIWKGAPNIPGCTIDPCGPYPGEKPSDPNAL